MSGRRAVFLDRDGTIIEDADYLSDPEGVILIPGAADALARLADAGFLLVVVTNQSGIARGYFTEAELDAVHARLDGALESSGAKVDAYYHCPHHPAHGALRDCGCRKPKTGMVAAAAGEMGIDISRSYFVGDKLSDVELAENAGGVPVLVLTGYGAGEREIVQSRGKPPVMVFDGLAEAADWIIKDSEGS